MPKAGEITVPITVEAASAAHDWLLNVYLPAKMAAPLGLLGYPEWKEAQLRKLTALVEFLGKKVDRKRKTNAFSINIERDMVTLYLQAVREMDPFAVPSIAGKSPASTIDVGGSMPFLVWEAAVWMRAAAQSRASRPTLTPEQRKARLRERYGIHERHRARMRVAVARDEEIARFVADGGSLLASDIPLPKI